MFYFGGKSSVADVVWSALGQPKHYLEPFFGSGAVLLNRPNYDPQVHIETVNDKDGFISNVWRSIQFSPEKTAKWCDWPVNHADLCARRKTLLANESKLLENLIADDAWHDPKLAGYWIWAASCWIGSGLTRSNAIPYIGNSGMGVNKLSLGQIPSLTAAGMGVNKQSVSHPGDIYRWFVELSGRLRRVRVVCGDWSRVCGGNWQDKMGQVGIFFDPPYGVEDRSGVYHKESQTVAQDVEAWCLERGEKETYRIVLAGYDTEHQALGDAGWEVYNWTADGGYSNVGKGDNQNRKRETLWLSPYCLHTEKQMELF